MHKNFLGKFGKIWAKLLFTPKNLLAPTPMRGAISVKFVSQVSLQVHYCKRWNIVDNTSVTKQWITKWSCTANAFFWIVHNVCFRGGQSPNRPRIRPCFDPCGRPWFLPTTSSKLFSWVQCKSAPIIVFFRIDMFSNNVVFETNNRNYSKPFRILCVRE